MLAVIANLRREGRVPVKGGIQRALPLWIFIAVMVAGAAFTTQALYIPVKAQVAQILLTRAFDASIEQGTPVKPWSWADTAPLARISVPHLDVKEVVLSGGSGEAMAFGPTAILDNPATGITVLAAHRDTHFEFVQGLEPGDAITMERIDGTSATFRVRNLQTVRWDEFVYPYDGGEGLLALTTCYPFGTHTPGPLRRVAWAERIGPEG